MATSLMFAILEVADAPGIVAAPAGTLAYRYGQLPSQAQKRVLKALYEAFYPILEARELNYTGPTRAIGEMLARIISKRLPTAAELQAFVQSQDVRQLKEVLTGFVERAIADEEP